MHTCTLRVQTKDNFVMYNYEYDWLISTCRGNHVFSDVRYNYCDLSVGFPDKMSKWMHQARQLLRLACAALENESYGVREADQKGTDRNHMAQEGSNLAGLAMRVMVSLTDSSTWKCFGEPGQEVRKRKAELVVLRLLEWLASGSAGLFLAVRSYILANFPVPGIKDQLVRPRGKKDKFIITASIITVTLRPLLVLSAECDKDGQNDENPNDRKDYTSAANRAAAQFSAHILTIPFLPQRLPQPLLPALQHPTALFPCLRSFGVCISLCDVCHCFFKNYSFVTWIRGNRTCMNFLYIQ